MKTVLRVLAGIVVGILVTFALVVAVELLSSVVHPFPEDFGGTEEEVRQHVERYPDWILGMAALAWAFTAFAGTWTAGRIGNVYSFAVVGLLVLASLVMNISMLPYPIWFEIVILIAVPIAILAAGRLSLRKRAMREAEGRV